MAWIQPNGVVFLYKNVPLLPNYRDTVYFVNQTAKDGWFDKYYYKSYSNISYQRVGKNKIRLEGIAEEMYSVNYMSFINNGFTNSPKMFYAFVDNCEYINNNVFELHYHIDVMVTWATEMVLEPCFVEREHVDDDRIGKNVVPEGFDVNEYYLNERTRCNLDNMAFVAVFKAALSSAAPAYQNGLFNEFYYIWAPATETGANALKAFLEANSLWLDHSDTIVKVFMFPISLINYAEGSYFVQNGDPKHFGVSVVRPDDGFKKVYGGSLYQPNNQKLYTYPYIKVSVNTSEKIEDFKFENFYDNETANFDIWGFLSANPKIAVVPLGYDSQLANVNKTVIDNNFPDLPFYINTFISILGNQGIVNSLLRVGGLIGTSELGASLRDAKNNRVAETARNADITTQSASGTSTRHVYTRSTTTTKSGARNVDEVDAQRKLTLSKSLPKLLTEVGTGGDYTYNKGEGGDILSVIKYSDGSSMRALRDIYIDTYAISGEEAKIIDDYLSYYGYAVSKIKVPNRHVRKRWTYVKTNGCKLHGNIPADDLVEIANIFDAGITFWEKDYTLGDYQLNDNPIILG